MTQIVLRPVSPGSSMSVIVDAIEHVAELARDSSATNVCFVTVDLDPIDVCQLQCDTGERPGKFGGVAVADGVDVNPVPDLDATGANPPMEATPADHAGRITHPEHSVSEIRPLSRRCRHVLKPFALLGWRPQVSRPRHPRSKMVKTRVGCVDEYLSVVNGPPA